MRDMVVDLEDLMLSEAIRQSLEEDEERQRRLREQEEQELQRQLIATTILNDHEPNNNEFETMPPTAQDEVVASASQVSPQIAASQESPQNIADLEEKNQPSLSTDETPGGLTRSKLALTKLGTAPVKEDPQGENNQSTSPSVTSNSFSINDQLT